MTAQTVLGFDFGLKRVGVSCGNGVLRQAQPLCSIEAQGTARFDQIHQLIQSWQPDVLVVGIPLHPDGAEHEVTRQARRFARQLHGRFGLAVHEIDERYSSVEAERHRPPDLDAAAAAVILQQYFDEIAVSSIAPHPTP